jgi:hypothetical protein
VAVLVLDLAVRLDELASGPPGAKSAAASVEAGPPSDEEGTGERLEDGAFFTAFVLGAPSDEPTVCGREGAACADAMNTVAMIVPIPNSTRAPATIRRRWLRARSCARPSATRSPPLSLLVSM